MTLLPIFRITKIYVLFALTAAYPVLAAEANAPGGPGKGYVLGAEDVISIQAQDAEEISEKAIQIDLDGYIRLPLLGRLQAAGLTPSQLSEYLSSNLQRYVRDPQVRVGIVEYHSHPISVIGAVNTPGVQQIRGRTNLVEALSLAGGLRPDAGPVILLTRSATDPAAAPDGASPQPRESGKNGDVKVFQIRTSSLLEATDSRANLTLLPNDIVSVPRAQMVYVMGEVEKAGGFVLNERENLSSVQALALAQGLKSTASPRHARVLHGDKEVSLRLDKIIDGKLPDVQLAPEDTLFIPSNIPKKAALRALEAAIQTGTGIAVWRR